MKCLLVLVKCCLGLLDKLLWNRSIDWFTSLWVHLKIWLPFSWDLHWLLTRVGIPLVGAPILQEDVVLFVIDAVALADDLRHVGVCTHHNVLGDGLGETHGRVVHVPRSWCCTI